MRHLSIYHALVLISFILFVGCEAVEPELNHRTNNFRSDPSTTVFIPSDDTIPTQTILGDLRTNPYTVAIMTQAWNTLYPNHAVIELNPTHLYVRFTAQNLAELDLLEETGEELYDYPLEYEVIQMGDYYPQTGYGSLGYIPQYYAVVPPDFLSPISGYEILGQLVIPPYFSYLTAEAFRITNNEYGDDGGPQATEICIPGCVNYPECLIDPSIGCGEMTGGGDEEPPCDQFHPDWPDCLEIDEGPSIPVFENFCGCQVYANQRKPGGCIKVWDVEHSMWEGVEDVKVIMKDAWFSEDETWTDEEGCWKINREYAGKASMRVKFKGSKGQVRSATTGLSALYEWTRPFKTKIGSFSGPRFNNIEVKFPLWNNQGGLSHILWGCATVNNALHDFHRHAGVEGIGVPPGGIDIWASRNGHLGYTLMNKKATIGPGLATLVLSASYITGPFLSIGLGVPVISHLPDAMIGIDFKNSDLLKQLSYHELAHAAHWSKSGANFWYDLVEAEIGAFFASGSPHGNPSSTNAGQIALVEGWAEHIAGTFAGHQYGIPNNAFLSSTDWNKYIEEVWNEDPGHIPIGLYNDLIDPSVVGTEAVVNRSGGGSANIEDKVEGFTNAHIYSLLGSSNKSPDDMIDDLIIDFLSQTNNTEQDVRNLLDEY